MMKRMIIMLSAFIILALGQSAHAIPSLQLDIQGGTYNSSTQTVIATSDPFTLDAYLIPDNNALLADKYYISAAITPQFGPANANLGSFTINGVTINVTSDMVYGNPPIDTFAGQNHDAGDLPPHDMFPSYFTQMSFTFDSNQRAVAYNTQDTPGAGPTPNPSGTMYYQSFTVDTSSLDPNYFIHFDLYNSFKTPVTEKKCSTQKVCTKNKNGKTTCKDVTTCIDLVLGYDIDINSFAPFSHDAQSDGHKVPEPSSFLLLGLGLMGLGFFGRKKK